MLKSLGASNKELEGLIEYFYGHADTLELMQNHLDSFQSAMSTSSSFSDGCNNNNNCSSSSRKSGNANDTLDMMKNIMIDLIVKNLFNGCNNNNSNSIVNLLRGK